MRWTKHAQRLATARGYDRLMDARSPCWAQRRRALRGALRRHAGRLRTTAATRETRRPAISQAATIDPQAPTAAADWPPATSPLRRIRRAPSTSRRRSATYRVTPPFAANSGVETAETEKTSFFEKLFGKPKPVALAYAAPDDAGLVGNIAGRYDQWTAVYDISAHKVYLPDGSVLPFRPRQRARRSGVTPTNVQGSTPVNVYDLKPRETLLHGVEAIRLDPSGRVPRARPQRLFGPHLHAWPQWDSFGCVLAPATTTPSSRRFKEQKIKHLAVVASL